MSYTSACLDMLHTSPLSVCAWVRRPGYAPPYIVLSLSACVGPSIETLKPKPQT
jgi:hypothetical protein